MTGVTGDDGSIVLKGVDPNAAYQLTLTDDRATMRAKVPAELIADGVGEWSVSFKRAASSRR